MPTQPHCGACVKSGRQGRCVYEAIRNKNLADQLEDRVGQLERMVERMEREAPPMPLTTSALAPSMMSTPFMNATTNGGAASGVPSSGTYSTCGFMPGQLEWGNMDIPLTRLLSGSAVEGWSRLPPESHDFMVETFLTYLPKSYLQVHQDRFIQALARPDDDPRSVHPAMMSAIYLLACYHWSDSLSSYEDTFLAQARAAMAESLSKTDRLFTGFIQPGILVAEYLVNRGRLREAYHQIIQTARFSMDCNLHKILTPIWHPGTPGGILPPPGDAIELGERILAFWSIFVLDQRCCVIMGLPSSFSKGDELDTGSRIDTVWPSTICDYEEGNVSDSEFMTLRFLCTDGPPYPIQDCDYTFRMRLQSFVLYRFAGDEEMPPADIDLAISQFIKRLPAPDPTDPINMPSVVVAHVVARAATIRLCARTSPARTMDERAIRASLGCARMIHMLTVSDYDMWTLDVVLVYIWADCAKIIASHIQEIERAGVRDEGGHLRPALTAISAGISKAAVVFPFIATEVHMVESLSLLFFAMSSHTLVVNRTPVPHTTPRHPYHGFRNTQSTHYPRAFCHYTPVPSAYAASTQMVVTLDGAPSLRPSVKSRKRVTPHQLKHLERVFAGETHPSRGSREELARDLGMELKSVTIWFQNKRQSIKRSVLSSAVAPSRSSSSSDDSSVSDGRSSPTLAFWSSQEPTSVEPESEMEVKPTPMLIDEEDVQYKETVAAQALCDLLFSAPRHHAPTRTPSAEP
ncbi:hypothetical protein BDV93DRAFT_557254 [Ceratobasidium sp. AG-I]|nr:hypothetical protein BDV93DRAFT_557254 [Ceratobasidium sp. AG-I]